MKSQEEMSQYINGLIHATSLINTMRCLDLRPHTILKLPQFHLFPCRYFSRGCIFHPTFLSYRHLEAFPQRIYIVDHFHFSHPLQLTIPYSNPSSIMHRRERNASIPIMRTSSSFSPDSSITRGDFIDRARSLPAA